jgi:hypothetical protein
MPECSLCTELRESHQRAVEYDLLANTRYSGEQVRYRWLIYRAHASACGAQK